MDEGGAQGLDSRKDFRMRTHHGLFVLLLMACSSRAPDAVGVQRETINGPGATFAQQWMLDRAVAINGCTATRIAPRWVLTAVHCAAQVGDRVNFYTTTSGTTWDPYQYAFVNWVSTEPGVSTVACFASGNCSNSSGIWADVAVLELDRDVWVGSTATMAWSYPGSGYSGIDVGSAGGNGGSTTLQQVWDTTTTVDDSSGAFRNTHDYTDPGDSGGPFYYGDRVLGVLWGSVWDSAVGWEDKHTSTRVHLDWILSTIGYQWTGGPAIGGEGLDGTIAETFVATERVCQYACDRVATCKGYNFNPTSQGCALYTSVTGLLSYPGGHYALKTGNSSHTGNPTAYRRLDGFDSVLHRSTDSHIHEIYMGNGQGWHWGDLFSLVYLGTPPPVAGRVSAFTLSDGDYSVLYRSTSGQVIRISLTPSGWVWADMTAALGANAGGDPVGYTSWDGYSAIFYRTTNNSIVMLQPPPGPSPSGGPRATQWNYVILTTSGAAAGDPMVYDRSDRLTAVVYRGSDNRVHELSSAGASNWSNPYWWGSKDIHGSAPAATGNPTGYVRHDGFNAVVFRAADGNIWESSLQSGAWSAQSLANQTGWPPTAGGDPTPYIRADATSAVVFGTGGRGGDVIEMQLTSAGWQPWRDLTLAAGLSAGSLWTNPTAHIRVDGFNSVVFADRWNRLWELTNNGGASWQGWGLSATAAETP